ncbi:hypothetical protein F5B20DRAFT_542737 [Whalleya microplaca]|nr:hypothetical protein F5B20DRAFT_542737 [Whalleya microplaca]
MIMAASRVEIDQQRVGRELSVGQLDRDSWTKSVQTRAASRIVSSAARTFEKLICNRRSRDGGCVERGLGVTAALGCAQSCERAKRRRDGKECHHRCRLVHIKHSWSSARSDLETNGEIVNRGRLSAGGGLISAVETGCVCLWQGEEGKDIPSTPGPDMAKRACYGSLQRARPLGRWGGKLATGGEHRVKKEKIFTDLDGDDLLNVSLGVWLDLRQD